MRILTLALLALLFASTTYGQATRTRSPEDEAQRKAEEIDADQTLFAQRWAQVFDSLDKRMNVTITLVEENQIITIENITEIRSESRFLIIKSKDPKGRYYHSIIYPGSIFLLAENPR